MLPSVTINKTDGSLGVPTNPDNKGILAIVGPKLMGPSTPTPATKGSSVLTLCGYGIVTEIASYVIPTTGKPVLLCQQAPSVAASYGSFAYTGSGSLSGFVTAHSGANPVDDIQITVRFVVGGTTGATGITYQYSVDAKTVDDPTKAWSAVLALGTALTFAIPNTGAQFDLTTTKTVVAGDYFQVSLSGPKLNDSDVSTQLTLLGRSSQPWECVLVEGIDASSTTVSNLDTFLAGLEANGKYRMFITGARLRAQDGTETEAQYLTAMTTAWGAVASIRGCVTADGGFFTSQIPDPSAVRGGVDTIRKTTIPFAGRLMAIDTVIDAAQVDLGPVGDVRTVDKDGMPKYHDEANDPGLDDIRLVTLRSFNNKIGTFITNPKVISTPGSDYVFAQQVRTMNRACELAFGILTGELSRGVLTDQKTGFIREDYAKAAEDPVNDALDEDMGKKVTFVGFKINRDDVLTPPSATVSGVLTLIMPVYIKKFVVNAKFAKTISVST